MEAIALEMAMEATYVIAPQLVIPAELVHQVKYFLITTYEYLGYLSIAISK